MQTYDAHKSTTEVRQASRSLGNFWVLLVSLAGVVVLFAVIFAIYVAMTPVPAIQP